MAYRAILNVETGQTRKAQRAIASERVSTVWISAQLNRGPCGVQFEVVLRNEIEIDVVQVVQELNNATLELVVEPHGSLVVPSGQDFLLHGYLLNSVGQAVILQTKANKGSRSTEVRFHFV